jgi:hypothetical protein
MLKRLEKIPFANMNTNEIQGMVETEMSHRSLPMFGQNEMEVSFSSDEPMTCCGEELKPFWAEDGRYISVCVRCSQKYTDKTQVRYGGSPWIGVDLDGTLAHDLGNKNLHEIGAPIKPMLNRLRRWIAAGNTVKIFTARASSPRQVVIIKKWLASHGLPDLEVTNVKDLKMIELWDDRCVQVTTNLGEPTVQRSRSRFNQSRPVAAHSRNRRPKSYGFLSRLKIFLTL